MTDVASSRERGPVRLPVASIPDQTTVFGSGMAVRGADLIVVTPSHQLEGVYHARIGSELVVSNSLVGVLTAAGLTARPRSRLPIDLWRVQRPLAAYRGGDHERRATFDREPVCDPHAVRTGDGAVLREPPRSLRPVCGRGAQAPRASLFPRSTTTGAGSQRPPRRSSPMRSRTSRSWLCRAATTARPWLPSRQGPDVTAPLDFALLVRSRRDGSVDDSGAATAGLLGLGVRGVRPAGLPACRWHARSGVPRYGHGRRRNHLPWNR